MTDLPVVFRVTAESLGPAAIGAFRNTSEAPPIGGSTVYAYRRKLPWTFVWERRIKDFLSMRPSKREREKEATR